MNTITTPFKRSFTFTLLALFLAGTGWLQAGSAGIQDNAGFFSAAAKADAQGNITLAQRTLHKDVQVETYATMPDTLKNGVNLQDKAAVNRAYEQWVNKRAESLGVDGVYILIVKDPPHLQVAVGNDTQKQAFTLSERDSLVKLMADKLHAKDYDAALRQGVAYVVSNMKQHAPGHARTYGTTAGATANNNLPWNNGASHRTAPAEKSGFPWGWVILLVIVFLGIRLVASLFHAIFRGGSGMAGGGMPMGGGYGGYPPSGGGGFMRSMFGGILGAAAGSWIYDSFFGSHGSSAYGAPPPGGYDGGQDGGYTGHDTSFSSSGSDYSDSGSGGSSWDSGSSGGGSDFGGGGSDFGGGGGDFGGGGDSGGGGSDF